MTSPLDDLPMPYSLSCYLASRYWYRIQTHHQQSGKENPAIQHHLARGEYMIMVTTAESRGARVRVVRGDLPSIEYPVIPEISDGKQRTGVVTISINEDGWLLQFIPEVMTLPNRPTDTEEAPLVMQVFPLESYKP